MSSGIKNRWNWKLATICFDSFPIVKLINIDRHVAAKCFILFWGQTAPLNICYQLCPKAVGVDGVALTNSKCALDQHRPAQESVQTVACAQLDARLQIFNPLELPSRASANWKAFILLFSSVARSFAHSRAPVGGGKEAVCTSLLKEPGWVECVCNVGRFRPQEKQVIKVLVSMCQIFTTM